MSDELKGNTESIVVGNRLQRDHPLVTKMRQAMLARRPEPSGLIEVPLMRRVFNVVVSRKQMPRTLRLWDALVRAVEQRGAVFVKSERTDCDEMHLSVDGEIVGITLTERVNKSERPLAKRSDSLAWRSKSEKWDYQLTGQLRFRIYESVPSEARRSWNDCSKHKLEDKLATIVAEIFAEGQAMKQRRIAREEFQRRRAEEWRRQEELVQEAERREQVEAENRSGLEAAAQNWREAHGLREFIQVCERKLSGGTETGKTGSWPEQWLAWARAHADRLDPLTNGFLEAEREKILAPSEG